MLVREGTMLRSLKGTYGYDIVPLDDTKTGEVDDYYFDDESARIRYLVLGTGPWLFGKQVLISPVALGKPDWKTQTLVVPLTKEQIQNSPDIDLAKPVTRQTEGRLHRYYGWPVDWGFPRRDGDTHLRSSKEVIGYHVQARDGEIGHLEDLIVDDDVWLIRYLVIDTRNWLPGKKVLISPTWLDEVSWLERKLYVDHLRQEIRESPEYDAAAPVNREYEEKLYDYYGRPRYWV